MMSNIWITCEYQVKVENIFEALNVFDVNEFFKTHRFVDYCCQTKENTNDHDINIVDDASYEVFLDHLNNYFPEIKTETFSNPDTKK